MYPGQEGVSTLRTVGLTDIVCSSTAQHKHGNASSTRECTSIVYMVAPITFSFVVYDDIDVGRYVVGSIIIEGVLYSEYTKLL